MKARFPEAMRGTLALLMTNAFILALWWLIDHEIPEKNEQLINFMLGQLSILAMMPMAFYFQTTKSSIDKNALLRPSAPALAPAPAIEGDPPLDLAQFATIPPASAGRGEP